MTNKPNASKICTICNKPLSEKYRPFCSKRCADLDLGKWLGEQYTIAGSDDDIFDASEETLSHDGNDA